MGMESLDLVLNCTATEEQTRSLFRELRCWPGWYARAETTCTCELVECDFLVQLEARPTDLQSHRVSIRTALCCAPNAVFAMIDWTRRVTAFLGCDKWDVLHEETTIGVLGETADQMLGEIFEARRQRLLSVYAAADVPYAARRPGVDCIQYVRQFSRH